VKMFDADKTRMIGLPYGEKKNCDNVKPFSSDTGTLRTDRRTDRQKDGQTEGRTELLYQYRASVDMSSAPVCDILSKSDHPQQKIMTSCRFSRWRISAILDFRGPIMGSLKIPCTTSYSRQYTP